MAAAAYESEIMKAGNGDNNNGISESGISMAA